MKQQPIPSFLSSRDRLHQRLEFARKKIRTSSGRRRKPLSAAHKAKISKALRERYGTSDVHVEKSGFDTNLDRLYKASAALANTTKSVNSIASGASKLASSATKIGSLIKAFQPPPPETKSQKILRIFDSTLDRVDRTTKTTGRISRVGKGSLGLAKDFGFETTLDKRKRDYNERKYGQQDRRIGISEQNLAMSKQRLDLWRDEIDRRANKDVSLRELRGRIGLLERDISHLVPNTTSTSTSKRRRKP